MAPKVVIFQYTETCNGIGDFIRAIDNMYTYCLMVGSEFFLDIQHPINRMFDFKTYDGDTSKFPIYDTYIHDGIHYSACHPDNIAIFNNVIEDMPSMNIPGIIIRTYLFNIIYTPHIYPPILTPTAGTINMLDKLMTMNKLTSNKFIAVHYRVGDICLNTNYCNNDIRNSNMTEAKENDVIQQIIKENKNNYPIVIFSDSYSKKKELSTNYEFKFIDIEPVHTSVVSLYRDNTTKLINTVLEFLIISYAYKIYSITKSGFPVWAARFNNKSCTNLWLK